MRKPAVSLAAVAGRRQATLELAQRLEQEGFSGIYCPSFGDGMGLCEALALVTKEIPFGTSIANIYTRHPYDYALSATLIHELSGGRFRFGIGVSHAPAHARLKVQVGKPLGDMRQFVSDLQAGAQRNGDLPPIVLATLRRKMVQLASEIAQGAVWANAARSHVAASLGHLSPAARQDPGFFLGNMIPICIDDDKAAAAAVNLRPIEGGRLTLRPFPTVAVRALASKVDGLRVAPWPRVYVDLRRSGVRGEEAAEHLREVFRGG